MLLWNIVSFAHALDNCASTDEKVNLNVPCVEYQGQAYQATLSAISHNKGGFPLCWVLADGITTVSTSSNCSSVDDDLNVLLACVDFENNNYTVALDRNSPVDGSDPCQWMLGTVGVIDSDSNTGTSTGTATGTTTDTTSNNTTQPVLYMVSMMHAEDVIRFDNNQAIFQDFATNLRRVSSLLASHGAKLDFGPDWTFLGGVINFDNQLLRDILAAGHGVHTHAHETSYNATGELYDLGVVNNLLAQAGAPDNKIANGGFEQNGPDGNNWIAYVADFKDSTGQQLFDMIIGYKDPQTQIPDSLGYIIQPDSQSNSSNWQVDDPNSSILYAGSNMPPFEKAGALDFTTIRSWIDKRLAALQTGKINTLYWHDSLHNYGTEQVTTSRLQEWESFLIEYLDEKVASGQIQWKTFTEMAALYKNQ